MTTNQAASEIDRSTPGRSLVGTLALALTAVSIVGFIVSGIGTIVDWPGFSDDPNDHNAFADSVWIAFALGGILALVAGIVAWLRGRSRRVLGDIRAGQMAVGWFVLAVIMTAIIVALLL